MKDITKINKETFIGKYINYCDNLETALSFDFWSAVWIISLLCNRNIIINRPNAQLFPNFYITFIADSGIARKSTAISLAKQVFDNIIEEIDNIDIINSTTSQSKLNYILTKKSLENNKCIIGINVPEFITFYKNKNIIECFTDLYDCPDERNGYGTFTNGEINIRNCFVSSLSGSTPNYYYKAINKDEIEGGFTSRNIIIREKSGKRKIAWSNTDTKLQPIYEEGRKLRKYIKDNEGKINLSTKAIQKYSNWYIRRKLSNNFYTKSFEAREQDYVLKLACILALNEYSNKIEQKHIELSIKIIKYYKNIAEKFFNEDMYEEDDDKFNKLVNNIRNIINSSGKMGIKHRDLYLRVHNSCTSNEFTAIINTMHELDMIEKFQIYNSKAIYYRNGINMYKINTDDLRETFNELRNN